MANSRTSGRRFTFTTLFLASGILAGASWLLPQAEADVRINSLSKNGFVDAQIQKDPSLRKGRDQKLTLRADGDVFPYQVPSNFGYAKLQAREKNNNDRFLRDNIDNEANQRNTAREQAKDMTPCRQDQGQPRQSTTLQAGQDFEIPLQFNNPHDGEAEVNIWRNVGTENEQVATIARFNSGGGYSQNRPKVNVPANTPACTPADKCLLQYYWHTVEPRTYTICTDLEVVPAAGAGKKLRADEETNGTAGGEKKEDAGELKFKTPIYYSDAFDTAHIDSTHSGYRGQDPDGLSDNMKARLEIQQYVGNGGLLKDAEPRQTTAARAQARNQVNGQIRAAERKATAQNKAQQRAMTKQAAGANANGRKLRADQRAAIPSYEGDKYSVVLNPNARRQFTNTYVTNVDYAAIRDANVGKMQARGLSAQVPAQKETADTPQVYGLRSDNLKKGQNAANLSADQKKALGQTAQKLLKLRAEGGDEEAFGREIQKRHDEYDASQDAKLLERAEDDSPEEGSVVKLESLEENEVKGLSELTKDLPDMSEGSAAGSEDGKIVLANNPDDEDSVEGGEEEE